VYSIAIGSGAHAGGVIILDPNGPTATIGSTNANTTALGSFAEAGARGDGQTNATAVGFSARANASAGTALGANTNASGANSTALGQGAQATFAGATALGAGARAVADPTTAVGFNALASGANATAVGATAVASGADSTAVGESAQAGFDNSTAIGRGVATTRTNQVALGTASNTYTLAGLPSAASIAAQSGPTRFVTTDLNGNLAASNFGPDSISALSGRLDVLGARVDQLSNRVDALSRYAVETRREARGGTAMSIASAQIRYDDRPGKISLGTGLGTFKGETGIAAGIGFTSPDQNWRANISASSSFRGDLGVGAGVTFTLN